MFPMFQKLRQYFEITAIDVLGFGCSGIPYFELLTVDGVLDWFTWQLRSWMDKTGYDKEDKGPYSIFCHSMGCYFSTHWAQLNKGKIK